MHTPEYAAVAERIKEGIAARRKEREDTNAGLYAAYVRDMLIGFIGLICMGWVFYVAITLAVTPRP